MEPDKAVPTREIASAAEIPKAFVSKILQKLTRAGIVTAQRGAQGGFCLAVPADQISLLDVIDAIQDTPFATACAVDARLCSRSAACAVHPVWADLNRQIQARLRSETFNKLSAIGRGMNREKG